MSTRLPGPAPGLSLWLVDLENAAEDISLLSAAERSRMSSFHFERDARRYARARCALRKLLGHHLDLPPGELGFREGPFGKPHLQLHGRDVPFSLSHSQERALVVIGESLPVGVDIEAKKGGQPESLEGLARSVMTSRELHGWLPLSQEARLDAFHRLWCAKEACLKAIGCGLQVEPRSVETGWASEPRDIAVPCEATNARVRLLPLPCIDGCAAAVAELYGDSAHLAR